MKIVRDPEYISGFLYMDLKGKLSAIIHCAETFFIRGHQVLPHAHPGFEFIYLSRGSATRQVGSRRIQQRMGDLYITYPRERHAVACKPSEEGRQIQIGLRLDKLGRQGSLLSDYLHRNKLRLLHDCQSVEPIMQAIIWQVVTNLPHRDEAIHAYLQTLCVLIQQAAINSLGRDRSETKMSLPYSYPVQKALFFMNKHLDRRIPLREFAAAAAAPNVCRFCTQFHQEVKMTPSAYHLQLRLDAARHALLQPSMDITSIALNYGFSSSQHFCMAFRRAFGMSPRGWKQSGKMSTTDAVFP
jgi:AraC-like DNA-binding protein